MAAVEEVAQERDRAAPIDEATRLLSIAAHVDQRFADEAIREFLTEPARAVAPSFGLDATAVLRECLVARRRRRIRDGLLVMLMAALLVADWYVVPSWVVVAMIYRFLGPKRRQLDRDGPSAGAKDGVGKLGTVILVVVVLMFASGLALTRLIQSLGAMRQGGTLEIDPATGRLTEAGGAGLGAFFSFGLLAACTLSLAMLAVLWIDRRAVWGAVTGRLRRGRFDGAPPVLRTGMDLALWSTGNSAAAQNLRTLTTPHVNCIVYRGSRPFVGSGTSYKPWSIAVALEPARHHILTAPAPPDVRGGNGDGAAPDGLSVRRHAATGSSRLSIIGLHDEVTREMQRLQTGRSLSPSDRLRDLRVEGLVFVPARTSPIHLDDLLMQHVFSSASTRPAAQLSGPVLRQVAEEPREWMRYYAAYVVESWDREVTVSVLMHYGLDDRNLYIECTPCVLYPVNERYRSVDALSERSTRPAVLDALGSWTVLPLTVLPRALHAVRSIKDTYQDSNDPRRFGVARSLREMAAAATFADYAQRSDVGRYLQILQTRIVRAIGIYLENSGCSAVDFMRQADAITVTNIGQGASVVFGDASNSNIGGENNSVSLPMPAPTPHPTTTTPREQA